MVEQIPKKKLLFIIDFGRLLPPMSVVKSSRTRDNMTPVSCHASHYGHTSKMYIFLCTTIIITVKQLTFACI